MRRLLFVVCSIAVILMGTALAEAWQTDIRLISNTDTLSITFGRNPAALDGYDDMDVVMPIAPPSPPYAYFALSDPLNPFIDKLTTDIREDSEDSVMWRAVLNSLYSPLHAVWSSELLPPGDFFLGAHYLGLEVTEWVNMKTTSTVSFWPSQVLDIVHIPHGYLPGDDPVISNWNPVDGTTGVPVTTDIRFDVTDIGSGINPASITLTVNGVNVSEMLSLTPIANGYRVIYEPPVFLEGETWFSVIAGASDNASPANRTTDVIAFRTGYGIMPVLWEVPLVTFTTSTLGTDTTFKQISLGADLSASNGFDLGLDIVFPVAPPSAFYSYFPLSDPSYPFYNMLTRDIHNASVIMDLWNIHFGNVDMVIGVKWEEHRLPSDKGCFVAYTFPPFYPTDDEWQDMREIDHVSFGPGRQVWIKTVSLSGDTAAPRIVYTIPGHSETGVAVSTGLKVAMTDAESGIDISSISLTVRGEDVTDDIVVTASSGTTFVNYTPPDDFPPMTRIDCSITVADLADPANVTEYDWHFTTGYFLTPTWMDSLIVWTSQPGEPLRHFKLFFGADPHGTDYFDYGLDQQMPPPVPGDVPYGFFTTPDSLWNQLTRDIRSSLEYDLHWSAMLNRISALGGRVNWISWNPEGLPEDGSFHIAWLISEDTTWQNMRTTDRIDIISGGNLLIHFSRGVPPNFCLSGTVLTDDGVVEGAVIEVVGVGETVSGADGEYNLCEIPYSTSERMVITSAVGYLSDTAYILINEDIIYDPYLVPAFGSVSGVIECEDGGLPEGTMIVLGDDTTFADIDGEYIFEIVPFGEYIIEVSKRFYQTVTRNILVEDFEHTEDFTLIRNIGNLVGTVTLEGDPPMLAGTMVELVGTDIPPAFTNAGGRYNFVEIPYDVYLVRFSRVSYVTLDVEFALEQPEDTLDVRLSLISGELNPPRNLTGHGNYPNRAVLDWDSPTPGSGTLMGYNVYRRVVFSDDTLVGFVVDPYSAFVEWGRTNYLPYNYLVSAVYDLGESEKVGPVLVWMNPDSTYPDILIWDFDNSALLANGGDSPEDQFLYDYLNAFSDLRIIKTTQDQNINSYDLFKYRAVFMVNGIDDANNTLPNFQSVNRLATYIAAGGRVYCEGADFGYDFGSVMASDQRRRLFNLFGAAFVEDGYPASSGNVSRIRGEDTSFFRTGAIDMEYHYMSAADHRIDEWDNDTSIEGTNWAMFSQDSPPPISSPLRMVYRRLHNYRTVLSSVYIGSMIDSNSPSSPSTRMHVLTAIVNFLLDESYNPPNPPIVEEKGAELPNEIALHVSPNPFNSSCKLTLDIDMPGKIKLDIYDINGRHIVNLADEIVSAGKFSAVWDGMSSDLVEMPSGVYFAVLKCGGRQTQSRLVLIK